MFFEVSQILVVSEHMFFPVIHLWGAIQKVRSFLNLLFFFPDKREQLIRHKIND